jgi:phage terminase large subunit GpA-like protein
MNVLRDPSVERIVLMTSSQVGKTEILNNLIGYVIDQDPSPILLVTPTLELAETWSKDRFSPMVRDTPCLRGKVAEAKTRDSGNTVLHKQFPGGHITVAGANSAASLASRPIRFVLCDEVDRYPASAGTEGDPVSLAVKRSATFWNRKVVLTSTPGIRGVSRIERAWEESDQRRFFLPCPGCGAFQHLRWGQVKWDGSDPETARYVCEACGHELGDHDLNAALRLGEWRPMAPRHGAAGFHLNELYSPWVPFAETVDAFFRAKEHRETLKVWVNTALGETWEEEGDSPDWISIKARAESYDLMTVPAGGLLLTAGVDVQNDRLAVVLRAWGRGEESWLVFWGEIFGDPVEDGVWAELDSLLLRRYRRGDGGDLGVLCAAVDSGGQRTQAVYEYARRRAPRVMAVKGAHVPGRPVIAARPTAQDVSWDGRRVPGGVQLWQVGSDTAKGEIYARLKIAGPGPRFMHFPTGVGDQFYEQLTAEKLVTRYTRGVPRVEWVCLRRNEALDCEVYAYAAALRAGLQRINWDSLEIQVRKLNDFAAPPVTASTAIRSRWITGSSS